MGGGLTEVVRLGIGKVNGDLLVNTMRISSRYGSLGRRGEGRGGGREIEDGDLGIWV